MSPNPLADRTTPKAMAAYWLNRTRSGEMSLDDGRAFSVWLDRDPANRAAYKDMERLWEIYGLAGDDPSIMKSCERDFRRFNQPAQLNFAATATLCAMVAALSGWAIFSSGVLTQFGLIGRPPAQELATGVGQRTTVRLKDQSVVTLDTDTLIRLRDTPWERRIELVRGRAFFQVAHDKSRPFVVAAGGKSVRATGTAFDVRVDPRRLQVTLVEGRVRVEADKGEAAAQRADLRAGWRLNVDAGGHWRLAAVDVGKETAWHEGRLSFFRDPLVDAVAEMNRYSDRKIVFRDGFSPDSVVVGVFRAGDIEGFVNAIEMNKIARVSSRSEEKIELAPR